MTFGVLMVLIVLGVLFTLCFPIAVIWSLNTLFALGISYSFETWLAALILTMVFSGGLSGSSKK